MNFRRHGGTIDEEPALSALQKTIARAAEELLHGSVIGDYCDDHVRKFCDLGKGLRRGASDFSGKMPSDFRARIVNRGDGEATIFQPPGHVRPHPSHTDKS